MNKKIVMMILFGLLLLIMPNIYSASLTLGSNCVPSNDQCVSPLVCNPITSKCANAIVLGGDCNPSGDICASSLFCNPTISKCASIASTCSCSSFNFVHGNDVSGYGSSLSVNTGEKVEIKANVQNCGASRPNSYTYNYKFSLFEYDSPLSLNPGKPIEVVGDDTIFSNYVSASTELNNINLSWQSNWNPNSETNESNRGEFYAKLMYKNILICMTNITSPARLDDKLLYVCNTIPVNGITYQDCDGNNVPDGWCGTANALDPNCDHVGAYFKFDGNLLDTTTRYISDYLMPTYVPGALAQSLNITNRQFSVGNLALNLKSYNNFTIELLFKQTSAVTNFNLGIIKDSVGIQNTIGVPMVLDLAKWHYLWINFNKTVNAQNVINYNVIYSIDGGDKNVLLGQNNKAFAVPDLFINGKIYLDELKIYLNTSKEPFNPLYRLDLGGVCSADAECKESLICKNKRCASGQCNYQRDCEWQTEDLGMNCATQLVGSNYIGGCVSCAINTCSKCTALNSYDNGKSKDCGPIEDCVNENCVDTTICSRDTHCQSNKVCINGICLTIKRIGDSCSGASDCPPGLSCTNSKCVDSTADVVITEPLNLGETCLATNQCVNGLECVGGECNQVCSENIDCSNVLCNANNVCGDLCAGSTCEENQQCDLTNGQCVATDSGETGDNGGSSGGSGGSGGSNGGSGGLGGGGDVIYGGDCDSFDKVKCAEAEQRCTEGLKDSNGCCANSDAECLETFVTSSGIAMTTTRGRCITQPGETTGYRDVKVCSGTDTECDTPLPLTSPPGDSLGLTENPYREECTVLPSENEIQTLIPFFNLISLILCLGMISIYYCFKNNCKKIKLGKK